MYRAAYYTKDLSRLTFTATVGAGFIVSNLVEYLLRYNVKKVIILDNFSIGYRKNIEPFLQGACCEQLIEGNLRDTATCKSAVNRVDYVSNQAALGAVQCSINDPIISNDVNFLVP